MAGRQDRRQPVNRNTSSSRNHRRTNNPLPNKRRRLIVLSSIGAAVIVVAGVAYAAINRPHNGGFNVKPVPIPQSEQNRLTTLLIGTDTRPGQSGGNTDSLIVMSIDYQHKRIELMSVPRDTKVMFPDGTYGKINEAYDIGGVSLTDRMVQDLIDVNIPNYAITHFGGLVNIINTIGGISVDVKERMDYNTGDKQYGIINLYPGYQKLNGEQALGFVRFREDPLGDIGRTVRQQAFLSALKTALFQPSNIVKLPTLVNEFSSTIDTNFSIGQIVSEAMQANQLKNFTVITETLPGAYSLPAPGAPSYWIVNQEQAKWEAAQFFYKGIKAPNMIETLSQVENWTPPLPGQSDLSGNPSASSGSGNGSNAGAGTSPGNSSQTPSGTGSQSTGTSTSGSTPSGTGTGSTPPTTAVTTMQMVVTGSSANIRSGPGTNYATIGSLLQGATVTVIGKAGDWDQVAMANGGSGYIASWLLGTP